MKIITISIANRIDRPPGGRGGERETRGAVDKSALIRWRLGSAGGTNESVQKRNASSSNPICARLGWVWRRAARSTANPDPPPLDNTENRGSRGVVTADETKGGEQNGETAVDRELLQPRIARELDN